ncbi:MAG TPA: DNA internalization-related competence protein ComEC/Rec2, partial [Caldilineaceae bacterium]|nr:DNA internalization-related competence protein ComEC/Rec2 [Caldilineaceae bacterium]
QRGQVTEIAGPLQGAAWRRALYDVRSQGEGLLNRLLAEPYAALANGMLLGIGDVIPDELYAAFHATNTSHVLVISGSNMVLLASLLLALSRRLLGMPLAVWPALVGVVFYTLLVGAEAPVVRAAMMSSLVIIAAALRRHSAGVVSLGVVGWLMALADPRVLWEVGFQLSMAATLGLLLFAPAIRAGLAARWPTVFGARLSERARAGSLSVLARGLLLDGLVMTLAANVLVLPLGLYHFGRFSPLFLLANMLILPVQPLILNWGLLALALGLAGLAWPAQAAAWVAWLGLGWTVAVVRQVAALPWASVAVEGYGFGWLAATYALIFAVYRRNQVIQAVRRAMQTGTARLVQPAVLGLGAAVAFLVWLAVWSLPDGRLHLYFLDVGQGDAILIQTPGGRQVLIDGGRDPALLMAELGAVMPFWDRSLDLLVLTHPDADHMGGQVELPRRMAVVQALQPVTSQTNPDGELWRAALHAAGVPVQVMQAGAWADLGDGVALWALWPPGDGGDDLEDNEASLVLKVVYGDFGALLTGDAGLASEAAWLAQGAPLQAPVLKVGHHGSNTSSGERFLAAVNPQVAVIQVGAGNAYGHPQPEVLDALAGRQVLRTDLHGRVHIWSDGRGMWVETER